MNRRYYLIAIAVVAVAVLAFWALRSRTDDFTHQREFAIRIVADGEVLHSVEFDTILDLEQHEFTVTRLDREHGNTYAGVLLRDLFYRLGVDLDGIEQVIARATDHYTVAFGIEEVIEGDEVYLIYKIDGQPLSPEEEGGSGPFRIVVRSDEFGQRWTKYLMEVEIR